MDDIGDFKSGGIVVRNQHNKIATITTIRELRELGERYKMHVSYELGGPSSIEQTADEILDFLALHRDKYVRGIQLQLKPGRTPHPMFDHWVALSFAPDGKAAKAEGWLTALQRMQRDLAKINREARAEGGSMPLRLAENVERVYANVVEMVMQLDVAIHGGWQCSACSLTNPLSATACSLCQTPKPLVGGSGAGSAGAATDMYGGRRRRHGSRNSRKSRRSRKSVRRRGSRRSYRRR
jgi:hypothetical protein